MFTDKDIYAEVHNVFRPMHPGRRAAFDRGAFDVEIPRLDHDKIKRFSLADIIEANSRISLEQFRETLPCDRAIDRVSADQVAA